jgi:hypothetical protein
MTEREFTSKNATGTAAIISRDATATVRTASNAATSTVLSQNRTATTVARNATGTVVAAQTTSTAVAGNATSTRRAANANATATSVAIPTATYEAQQAAWRKYFDDVAFNLSWLAEYSTDFPRGLVIGQPRLADLPFLGRDWQYGARYPARFSVADTSGSGVATLVYASGATATSEMSATIDGLVRTGWQRVDTDRIDGDHTCLAYTSAAGVEAICFAQRDRVVIIGYSTLPTDAPDAVLMNAADLTQMGLLATRDLVLPE